MKKQRKETLEEFKRKLLANPKHHNGDSHAYQHDAEDYHPQNPRREKTDWPRETSQASPQRYR